MDEDPDAKEESLSALVDHPELELVGNAMLVWGLGAAVVEGCTAEQTLRSESLCFVPLEMDFAIIDGKVDMSVVRLGFVPLVLEVARVAFEADHRDHKVSRPAWRLELCWSLGYLRGVRLGRGERGS
jgi:hypothetical protein